MPVGLFRRATPLDFGAERSEPLTFDRRRGISIPLVAECSASSRMRACSSVWIVTCVKYPACIFRDVLKGANHCVGLLRQVKKQLDCLNVDLCDRIKAIEGSRKSGFNISVEAVDGSLDVRSRICFGDTVCVDLSEDVVDR